MGDIILGIDSCEDAPGYLDTADFYVKNGGSDVADGTTPSTAWATIAKVNSSTFSAGDVIAFNAGDTFEGTLIPPSSGVSGNPIIIGAYGSGNRPIIAASDELNLTWSTHSGSIYKATYSTPITQLFLNDDRQQLARLPNSGYFDITAVNSATQFASTDIDGSKDYTGGSWVGRTSRFHMSARTISAQTSQTISIASAPFDGSLQIGYGFYLCDSLDCLTRSGEWFHDTATNTLYVWTPNGTSPSNYTVQASIRDYCVNIDTVNYLQIQTLEFAHAKIGVRLDHADHVTLDRNYINSADWYGINVTDTWSTYCSITNSSIMKTNCNAIRSYASYLTVTDNLIEDTGVHANLNSTLPDGVDNIFTALFSRNSYIYFEYNRIINTGYNGIYWRGVDSIIRYNFIDNYCDVLDDGGGVYSYSGSGYLTDYQVGTVIDYNIFKNGFGNVDGSTGTFGNCYAVYLDNGCRGVDVLYNMVIGADCGFDIHDGGFHNFSYNKVYNTTLSVRLSSVHDPSTISNNYFFQSNRIGSFVWWSNIYGKAMYQVGLDNIDYNKYYSPYDIVDYFPNKLNFADWQSGGEDVNGSHDGTQFTTEVEEIFYNDTKEITQTPLVGTYKGLDGTPVSSPLSLLPFRGVILIKQ